MRCARLRRTGLLIPPAATTQSAGGHDSIRGRPRREGCGDERVETAAGQRAPARGRGNPPPGLPDRGRGGRRLGDLVCGLACQPVRAARAARRQAGPQRADLSARRARPAVHGGGSRRAVGGLLRPPDHRAAGALTRRVCPEKTPKALSSHRPLEHAGPMQPGAPSLRSAWAASWAGWCHLSLFMGFVPLILGITAPAHPTGSLNVIAVLLGILLVISGIFPLTRFFAPAEPHRIWLGFAGLL